MDEPSDTRTIDFSHDREDDDGREVDAETYVSAASVAFNNAALPPDMPEWLKATIRADAAAIREAMQDDEVRLTGARQRRDEEQDSLDTMWQAARAQRERDWDRSRVAIGSVTLSGEEWDAAYETLTDPKMREQLVQTMLRKKGWSQDRAEKAADDALTLAQIARAKKDGTITPDDEAKAREITRRNPDAVEMVKEAAREKLGRGLSADADASSPARAVLSADMTVAADEYQNAMKASVAGKNSEAFASAPNLASQFDAARDAALAKPTAAPVKPVAPQLVAQVDIGGPF